MEVLVDSLDESSFEYLHGPIMAAGTDAVVDPVATYHFPSDGPKNLVPIVTDTDGNCFFKLQVEASLVQKKNTTCCA